MCAICDISNDKPALTLEGAREAVARGVSYLNDDQGKGWEKYIDRAEFDVLYGPSCVGGQLFGDYYTLRNKLGGESDAIEHGFSVWDTEDGKFLNQAWNEHFDSVSTE